MIKSFLKRPAYVLLTLVSYFGDVQRYLRFGAVFRLEDSPKKLEALIRKDCHRLEKGLALPSPRIWFGVKVITRLARNLQVYSKRFPVDHRVFSECISVTEAYGAAFSDCPDACPEAIRIAIAKIQCAGTLRTGSRVNAGVKPLDMHSIGRATSGFNFRSFLESRSSVRGFGGCIEPGIVDDAVSDALLTPSVCNRCAWRVRHFIGLTDAAAVLACQNGNAGFRESCGNVLIVSVDLRCFEGPGERVQSYVDGGLFAMNLVNALHARGVATCFLNWSADYLQDQRLRRTANIPEHEVVITMIAVGKYPKAGVLAVSPRPSVSDVLSIGTARHK